MLWCLVDFTIEKVSGNLRLRNWSRQCLYLGSLSLKLHNEVVDIQLIFWAKASQKDFDCRPTTSCLQCCSNMRTSDCQFRFSSRQNLANSVGNPRGLWCLVEGIHGEIWVVSETRIYVEIRGKFLMGVEMRGKFHQPCKHFNSPKNDIKSSLEYSHITWTILLFCH